MLRRQILRAPAPLLLGDAGPGPDIWVQLHRGAQLTLPSWLLAQWKLEGQEKRDRLQLSAVESWTQISPSTRDQSNLHY